MKVKQDYDVGVIVGRFQVHELHKAHIDLIQTVCTRHDKVLIFLGLSPLMVTTENPLDYESRKQMILEKFPKVNVLYVKDQFSDQVWSKKLDEQIADVTSPAQSVVLYGSRDSFMGHYHGKYSTQELEQEQYVSGSEVRKTISRSVRATPDFRAGVIWASHGKFPTCYPTVDVAIFSRSGDKVLLGRKSNEEQYRLIGGFADPNSYSYEDDARREVQEEASIEISDPVYVTSAKVEDWRYRKERDCIKTLLFRATHVGGDPRPDDDIAEVKWFDVAGFLPDMANIMPNHRVLLRKALEAQKANPTKWEEWKND